LTFAVAQTWRKKGPSARRIRGGRMLGRDRSDQHIAGLVFD
jgi:hypothetical protein